VFSFVKKPLLLFVEEKAPAKNGLTRANTLQSPNGQSSEQTLGHFKTSEPAPDAGTDI